MGENLPTRKVFVGFCQCQQSPWVEVEVRRKTRLASLLSHVFSTPSSFKRKSGCAKEGRPLCLSHSRRAHLLLKLTHNLYMLDAQAALLASVRFVSKQILRKAEALSSFVELLRVGRRRAPMSSNTHPEVPSPTHEFQKLEQASLQVRIYIQVSARTGACL